MKTNVYTIGQVPSIPRGEKRKTRASTLYHNPIAERPRCKVCGFRIRGEHHNDGGHHKGQKFGN